MAGHKKIENLTIPTRNIGIPTFLSDVAQSYLHPMPDLPPYPPLYDKAAWITYVSAVDQTLIPILAQMSASVSVNITERKVNDAKIFDILPAEVSSDSRPVVLEVHGGALILCGGDLCRGLGVGTAARIQRRIWSIDYRMPPSYPYPAGLEDCLATYRILLSERSPEEIIVSGGSAGGNLATAMLLRARDEGLPMPAGLVLCTPEIDLTESGDSFQTNEGVDPGLRSLMAVNLLYADGQDLSHPYLSPLFGDLRGFPPTILTTGTRDLFLSNTVRMHRKLRDCNVRAELHVIEAGPHTGFPGSPEGLQIDAEIRRFIKVVLCEGS